MKRLYRLLLLIAASLSFVMCAQAPISEDGWAKDVKQALNDFIYLYGHSEQKEYVVFDFDNTCCIYDVSEQFIAYQLENMCFELDPPAFAQAIRKGLESCRELTEERTDRAALLYESLYGKYGPFSYRGVDESSLSRLASDAEWLEFAGLMGGTYHLLARHKAIGNPYLWAMGWFAGMTSEQLYDAFVRSNVKYAALPTAEPSWGEYQWVDGLKVTDNIRELWKALNEAGIDVWVCSASSIEAVLASIDAYGLHDYCTGAIAMTLSKDGSGRFDGGYDYESGYGFFACHKGQVCNFGGECDRRAVKIDGWHQDNVASGVQTKGPGKVTAIERCIMPLYDGRGPLAAFGDSSGDFNFLTEFASLKLAVCFNRAELDVNDGGALLAELAMYQKDALAYDLKGANASGDILYVLQGRDVNGLRSLYPDNGTVLLGEREPRLFYSERSDAMLQYFKDNHLSTKEILNNFCIRTAAGVAIDTAGTTFAWPFGWLSQYDGYRSK